MTIRLLLFASYRDFAGGTDELTLDLPAGANALAAVSQVRARFPRIPERPVIALNKEFSSLDVQLNDGDELALLPPVAGG